MTTKLDTQFESAKLWRDEALALRDILLGCDVSEEMKWGKACYVHDGKNIAIIQRMNDFLSLMFFKGAALEDPDHVLKEQGPNSRFAKRMEFTSLKAVKDKKAFIETYMEQAIALENKGIKVDAPEELVLVDELKEKLAEDPQLSAAFDALTPGRQRGYNLHVGDAKQSVTRYARIEKARAKIIAGKGFNER